MATKIRFSTRVFAVLTLSMMIACADDDAGGGAGGNGGGKGGNGGGGSGGSNASGGGGSGGSNASGGSGARGGSGGNGGSASGGSSASGGATASGGSRASGGSGGAANGGAAGGASGGASGGAAGGAGGATGGRGGNAGASAGGAGSGGTPATGGTAGSATGGASGGVTGTGGAATGGTSGSGNDGSVDGPGGCGATGFHVEGGRLLDKNCNEFIIRGVNYPYAWYTSEVEKRFGDVASTKANAIRIVMATGGQWTRTTGTTVTQLIAWAKANKLVAILEVHDSTGYSEKAEAKNPEEAVAYWTSDEIASVLKGTEAYVMINIANEPFGNTTTAQWEPFHTGAVGKLRAAGLRHTLIVDAPNWGQDWSYTMRDGSGADNIFKADPDKNVVFSIHMYDVYNTAQVVTDYLTKFLAKGLPLIVGEFAADHGPGKEVDEGTILSLCQQKGIGYAGWSWSGNSSDLASLDMTVNFNLANLTSWGTRIIKGANGITETAKVCSVFP